MNNQDNKRVKRDSLKTTGKVKQPLVPASRKKRSRIKIMSGDVTWGEFTLQLDDKIRAAEIVEEGLPYATFKFVCEKSPFSETFWSEALGLSKKSLQRYKNSDKKFKPLQAEKIMEIAEVSGMGKTVFDNDEAFNLWLNTPNFALGKKKPVDLIKNSYGKELVLRELVNIDQGIFV